MRNGLLISAFVTLIFLPLVVIPVQADAADDFIQEVSWTVSLTVKKMEQGRPVIFNSARDYIDEGNYWKGRCQEDSRIYNERLNSFVRQKQEQGILMEYSGSVLQKASMEQKEWFAQSAGFYIADPGARNIFSDMRESCKEAEQNYNKAYEQTPETDYEQQAEIFHEGADVYNALGDNEGAVQVREAEAAAEGRAAARDMGVSDCLIVTATFGSPMAGEVQLVRDFRDDTMKKSYLGSRYVMALNAMYYSFSPTVARTIDENPSVKPVMRLVLAPLVGIVLLSQGVYSLLSFSPGFATIVFILIGGALVGIVYVFPIMFSAIWIAAKRKWQVPAVNSLMPVLFLWAGLLPALVLGAVLKIDLVAILSSGLLFVCTMFLTAGAAALYLFGYSGAHPAFQDE